MNAFDIRVFPASHFILVIPRVQNNVASFGSFLGFLLFHTNSRLQLPLLIYQLLFLLILLSDSRKLNEIPFPLVSPPFSLFFGDYNFVFILMESLDPEICLNFITMEFI